MAPGQRVEYTVGWKPQSTEAIMERRERVTISRNLGRIAAAVAVAALLTACDPAPPGASPSAPAITPSAPVDVTPPSPSPTPPPSEGWPREGWTQHPESNGSLTAYFPSDWYFESDQGYWRSDVYRVFCDAHVDAATPDAQTVATTRWSAMFGPAGAADQQGFTSFWGADIWGANVMLGDGLTVEPRAVIVFDDVWIECGALTRGTGADGAEFWKIIDSIQVWDKNLADAKPWTETP